MSFKGQMEKIGKSGLNNLVSSTMNAVIDFGKSAVHALMPDDYEYYLCSLELYDSDYNKVGFLSFVVMPDQISENHVPIQTITKTHGGIVTTFNPTFAPIDITLAGTFGKKFRLISDYKDPTHKKSGFLNINFGKLLNVNMGVKSGYGLTKILDHILKTANTLDDNGRPYFLCFNNYAFNTSYIVNVMNYNFSQSYEQNMIWFYQISLRAVGEKPKKVGNKMGSLLGSVASNSIANGLTKVITGMVGF